MSDREAEVSTVEFSARVPQSEYARFKARFPQYGSVQWFINSVLKQFNDRLQAEPSLEEVIHESIQSSIDFGKLMSDAKKALGTETKG